MPGEVQEPNHPTNIEFLEEKVDKLEKSIDGLKNKPKDGWDKFQIAASLLIPASITLVGIIISIALSNAEITSSERIVHLQGESEQRITEMQNELTQQIAEAQNSIEQANIISTFFDRLIGEDTGERELAIKAVLIALPTRGPELVEIVSRTDENEHIREIAKTQVREVYATATATYEEGLLALAGKWTVESRIFKDVDKSGTPRPVNAIREFDILLTQEGANLRGEILKDTGTEDSCSDAELTDFTLEEDGDVSWVLHYTGPCCHDAKMTFVGHINTRNNVKGTLVPNGLPSEPNCYIWYADVELTR